MPLLLLGYYNASLRIQFLEFDLDIDKSLAIFLKKIVRDISMSISG
jgi:hypothetical protein